MKGKAFFQVRHNQTVTCQELSTHYLGMLICKASEGDVEMLFTFMCYSAIYINHTWKQQTWRHVWLRIIKKKKKKQQTLYETQYMELNSILLKLYFSCQGWSLSITSPSKAFVVLRKESWNLLLPDPLDAGYVHGTEAAVGGPIPCRHLDVNFGVSL